MNHVYNRYANMKFDRPVIEESLQVDNPPGVGENLGTQIQYKDRLISEAIALGIPAKRTWGIIKLKRAIDGYGQ